MRKSTWLPVALLIVGIAFYLYYGITWNAWIENLPNILIYIVIIIALRWALRKKEQMNDQHKNQ
ncbi:MAG: hypothetical protein K5778_02600 [Bacteroidaceae bacterium]|nr:hypothetical protein [Bacteroidaceae bacterium]MDO4993562.1 hypothetical protein [Bacteroidales bacterium]